VKNSNRGVVFYAILEMPKKNRYNIHFNPKKEINLLFEKYIRIKFRVF
jgi:hypothetical protein